jgi:hypothetical protein
MEASAPMCSTAAWGSGGPTRRRRTAAPAWRIGARAHPCSCKHPRSRAPNESMALTKSQEHGDQGDGLPVLEEVEGGHDLQAQPSAPDDAHRGGRADVVLPARDRGIEETRQDLGPDAEPQHAQGRQPVAAQGVGGRRVRVLENLRVGLSEDPCGVAGQREDARRWSEAHRGDEQDAPDQARHRSKRAEGQAGRAAEPAGPEGPGRQCSQGEGGPPRCRAPCRRRSSRGSRGAAFPRCANDRNPGASTRWPA